FFCSVLAGKSHEVGGRGIVHPEFLRGIWGCQATRTLPEMPRMNIHTNARLTPHGRGEIARRVREGGPAARAAARSVGVREKTVRRWGARSPAEGAPGDRSSRP